MVDEAIAVASAINAPAATQPFRICRTGSGSSFVPNFQQVLQRGQS
jgi:hypothetical protein